MLIVQVCDFGSDGDACYRLHDPSVYLSRLDGVTVVDCHFAHRYLPELTRCADVLVVQFVDDWEMLSVCARRRERGLVTIFEANDYFFDMQPWSPIVSRWQDRTVQELYLRWLAEADGVQTSTEELARRWRRRGARRTGVFENQLTEMPELPPAADRPLTIGWGGSPGHFADWYQASAYLAPWLDSHHEVRLAVMANELARPFFKLPPERYGFTPFGSLGDYLRFLGGLDIGIAPLLPTQYNRCRSDVKFLEYASRGVVGIYADLEPYRGKVIDGETGLLYRTGAELIERLESLRNDPALRHRLRRQAHDYVHRQRRLPDHIDERLAWYRSLLAGRTGGAPLPDEVENTAIRQGRYLQLRPQEPERIYIEARKAQTPAESIALLTSLVEIAPHYLAALQSLGPLLNGRRDFSRALEVLERARALEPRSPRTLMEIGRTHYLQKDLSRAKSIIKEVVVAEPLHLPAWQYLLRLLSLDRGPDGPEWARRADELFPNCYPLALLGAQTYPAGQVASVIRGVLVRTMPTLAVSERLVALGAFREAILAALQKAPFDGEALALLRSAVEVFPESARLTGELGTALRRAGLAEEAIPHQARALRIARQAAIYRDEFPQASAPDWNWQFADFIQAVSGEQANTRGTDQ